MDLSQVIGSAAAVGSFLDGHANALLVVITSVYVFLTLRLVLETRRQNNLNSIRFAATLRPLALVQREAVPGGWEYLVRNVGSGVALDVVYVRDRGRLGGTDIVVVNHLGALPAGGAVKVPTDASQELSSYSTASELGQEVPRHLVFARPVAGDQWFVTACIVQPSGGHVQSFTQEIALSSAEIERIPLEGAGKCLELHWPQIRPRLRI